jgi:oxygen-independent coproporphyrinogen-3 oxidase
LNGIYIHIPYCKQACSYCDFHFSTSLNTIDALVHSICAEIRERSLFFGIENASIDTLYFGGGTPSLLEPSHLEAIFDALTRHFTLDHVTEITIEANPDDITDEKLKCWKSFGINRISLGVQTFDDRTLSLLNRCHSRQMALNALHQIRDFDFEFNADLIFGLPGSSSKALQQDIDTLISFQPDHISAYALTVEPKTALDHQIKKGLINMTPEEHYEEQFFQVKDSLESSYYRHYEISNYAKAGKAALHNGNYWQGHPYLGIGPSAHSFIGNTREKNISHNIRYIKHATQNKFEREQEVLSKSAQMNEFLLTRLRTMDGISISEFNTRFGTNLCELKKDTLQSWSPHISWDTNKIRLTREGLLWADAIAMDLFV